MNLLRKKEVVLNSDNDESIIVIGAGPVGIQFVKSLLISENSPSIIIFGDEPWNPYNRVKLSSFFAGQVERDDLDTVKKLDGDNLLIHNNCAIQKIDTLTKTVVDEIGETHKYSKLIMATGSRPHIPNVEGVDLENVFTFRSLTDVENLIARRTRSRKTAVIGGGVLGIEAAKAMTRQNTEVTIIDYSLALMSNQLDEHASELLREHILSLGIKVYLGQVIKKFKGDGKVEKILLSDGREFDFDTVILTTGIKPNITLARQAKLSVGKGIRVNDSMQTSNKDIFAIGECAEHRGKVYGVVKPGYEQAKVAAFSLYGKKTNYTGSLSATQIKVIDIKVFSMGEVTEVSSVDIKKQYVFENREKGIYRKLIIKKHRIIGAIAIGEWNDLGRIQESISNKRFLAPWLIIRFIKTGNLWPEDESLEVSQWPAATVVCNCTGVTRGELSSEIINGSNTLENLCSTTGAATVCGSCKPHVSQLLTGSSIIEPALGAKKLFLFGAVSILIMLLAVALPDIPYAKSVQVVWQWDMLWRENIFKQISGYSLFVITAIALILSLKKRIKIFTFLSFQMWRVIHVVLGFVTIIGFAIHSGYRLGEGLNFYLALSFVVVLIAGGASSVLVSLEHKLDVAFAKKIKSKIVWLHILSFWPFPALLAAHIFKSYYF